jgi:hypothetical protein
MQDLYADLLIMDVDRTSYSDVDCDMNNRYPAIIMERFILKTWEGQRFHLCDAEVLYFELLMQGM